MACEFKTNQEVVDKVIEKGFDQEKMPISYTINCKCKTTFEMDTYLKSCPTCQNQYAITPCSADSRDNIVMVEAE